MLHYLIKVTDNSLAVVILLAVLLGLLRTVDWSRGKKAVCIGLGLGTLAALIYAVLKRNTGFAVREYYDLGVNIPAVILAVLMIPCSLFFREAKKRISLVVLAVAALFIGTLSAYILPNIFLYPFEFGVGMDSIYNTDYLARVTGYLAGILLMFLIGLGLYKTTLKAPGSWVILLFVVLLLIFAAKTSLEIGQVVVARRMILNTRALMPFVMFALTHVNWFAFALLSVTGLFTLGHMVRQKTAPLPNVNPALLRKERSLRRSQLRYSVCILLCIAMTWCVITLIREYDGRDVEISEPIELTHADGKILIPLEQINDGNLHRFGYTCEDGTHMRYIVIRKSESAYGVGLDACDICGASGYYQRKDQVICKLCDVVMNKSTIGFPGGCNPVPLRFSISHGHMVIETQHLEAERIRFK